MGGISLRGEEYRQDADLPEAKGSAKLYFVRSGSGMLQWAEGETPLRAGDVILPPRAGRVGVRQPEGLRITLLCCPADALPLPTGSAAEIREYRALLLPEAGRVLRLSAQGRAEGEYLLSALEKESADSLTCSGLFLCLAAVIRAAAQAALSPVSPPQALEKALRHLEERYAEDVPLEELARLSGVSPRHFDRMFAAALGVTPKEYVARLRMARARALLRRTRKPITEIAFDCGYADSNYFARVFRRLCGCSPQQYRQNPEKNE